MAMNCPSCGAAAQKDAVFCGQCGEKVGATACPSCGAGVPGGAAFCPGCGKSVAGTDVHQERKGRLARHSGAFASRFEFKGIVERLFRRVEIEHGTQALCFIDGRYAATLPPGFHDLSKSRMRQDAGLQGLRSGGNATLVLISSADEELRFTVEGLRDKEQMPLLATGTLVTRVADPAVFFLNMMSGREHLRLNDLGNWLQDELRDALAEAVSVHVLDELVPGSHAFKQKLELDIGGHLKKSLDRNGLELVQLRSLRLANPAVEALREERAKIRIEDRKVETYRDKAAVLQRMRDAVNSTKMDSIRTEEQMAAFLQEIDKGQVLRQEEMDEFLRAFAEKKEDHQRARFHLLQKLELEQGFELKRIQLIEQGQLDETQLDRELTIERKRLEGALAQEATRFEHGLKQRGAQFDQDLTQQGAKFDQALKQKSATVEAEIEAKRKASELKQKEAREGVDLLEKIKRGKHEREKELAELESRTKIDALKAKVEFSAEQLAFIQAAESPEVAEALKEKFRAEHSEGRRQDVERHHTEMVEEMRRSQDRQDDLAKEALRTQRDAAGAVAAGRRAGTGTSGRQGPQTGDEIICRKCTAVIALQPLLKFCPKCGEPVS